MVLILRLINQLASPKIVNISRPVLRPTYQIPVAITNRKTYLHMSILMMPSEFSDRITYSQVPEFDSVVCTSCEESIKCIVIAEGTLVKFDRVGMSLVIIVHSTDGLVRICIIDNQFFIRTANYSNS